MRPPLMTHSMDPSFYRIISSQTDVHPRLENLIKKYQSSRFQAPARPIQKQLFDSLFPHLPSPILLDLGCGTGMSSGKLACAHPECTVLGVDKSWARLSRHPVFSSHPEQPAQPLAASQGNLTLLWADAIDLIVYCQTHAIAVSKVTLYYPNPWPKASHLQRRWHGHPVITSLIALGASIELRTNWLLYAKEFTLACRLLNRKPVLSECDVQTPLSLFEQKFIQSGVTLYQVDVP